MCIRSSCSCDCFVVVICSLCVYGIFCYRMHNSNKWMATVPLCFIRAASLFARRIEIQSVCDRSDGHNKLNASKIAPFEFVRSLQQFARMAIQCIINSATSVQNSSARMRCILQQINSNKCCNNFREASMNMCVPQWRNISCRCYAATLETTLAKNFHPACGKPNFFDLFVADAAIALYFMTY